MGCGARWPIGKPAAEKAPSPARCCAEGVRRTETWSWRRRISLGHPGDMVDALEQLASRRCFAAQADDGLDDLEDELFRFSR